MSPTPPDAALPDDEETLARLSVDVHQPDDVRRRAFERLRSTIDWVARRVSFRFSSEWRTDILEDAAGDVWTALCKGLPDGPFESWCYAVLRHLWLDRVRREARRRPPLGDSGGSSLREDDLRQALERAIDALEVFGEHDLQVLRGWPLRDRLVLLCITNLWTKVPNGVWREWVLNHRDRYGVPDGDLFPPTALADCHLVSEKNEILSGTLEIKRNTLSQLLCRGKQRLLDLRYIREFLDISEEVQP